MSNGPIEPSADLRTLAHTTREVFIALIREGFTEAQALQIVTTMLLAARE